MFSISRDPFIQNFKYEDSEHTDPEDEDSGLGDSGRYHIGRLGGGVLLSRYKTNGASESALGRGNVEISGSSGSSDFAGSSGSSGVIFGYVCNTSSSHQVDLA